MDLDAQSSLQTGFERSYESMNVFHDQQLPCFSLLRACDLMYPD